MRTRILIGAVACLMAVTGCSSAVRHRTGDAAPAGSPGKATSSAAPSNPPTSSPASTPSPEAQVLGPDGFGALKLGMSRQQASSTGTVTSFAGNAANASCPWQARLAGAPAGHAAVLVSARLGIVAISAYGTLITPQGVQLGTPVADLRKAYPDWAPVEGKEGTGLASIPGRSASRYRIVVANGVVTGLTLELTQEDCFG